MSEVSRLKSEVSRLSAGVDIGGTKIAVGLVDREGSILAQRAFPTDAAAGFDKAVARIIAAVDECLAEAKQSRDALEGVGIGCAGPVSPARGTIDNPYTLPTWDGVDIVSPLKREFDRPVILENDADAAIVGEAHFGAGRGRRRLVMFTYGTGIGSGVLVDGRIYRGVDGVHPELGHIPVEPTTAWASLCSAHPTQTEPPECYCGTRGCFESIASGTAISAAGAAAGFGDARGVFAATAQGDRQAQAVVDRAVQATFTAVWTIQHTFVPERIILGGGIIDDHFELFAAAARQAVERATMNPRGCTDVAQARLGNRAGLVGAAQLVRLA